MIKIDWRQFVRTKEILGYFYVIDTCQFHPLGNGWYRRLSDGQPNWFKIWCYNNLISKI